MTRNTIRLVVVLGTVSIIGIIIIQWYWVQKAFDIKEKQFNQTINISLRKVAERMAKFNNNTLPNEDPVAQISSDYYIVNFNDVIDANILEHYLKQEFIYHNMDIDFEYAIYDCTSDKMVYGDYINLSSDPNKEPEPTTNLPKYEEFIYYFGVNFPTKSTYLVSKMGIWIFFSLILLFAIIFFGYALFVILQQKRLSEVQKDFINNMTHEFKTPISTIAISADVISDPEIVHQPEKLKNYAGIIKDENNRLKNQVEKVLQMAILGKDELRLKKEQIKLHPLLKQVISSQELSLKKKNGRVEYDLMPGDPEILADPFHLTNIIYNLLDNAIKYTPVDPLITITTRATRQGIQLIIGDNGPGIKKEHHKKIFDKFFRISTGNIHNVKGFGLGLHYVKKMAKAHKWTIALDSKEEEGSQFMITIPL